MQLRILCAALLVFGVSTATAQEPPDDQGSSSSQSAENAEQEDVDRVSLAATLVRDGHYGRAQTVLAKVDTKAEETDRALYHTLQGIIALREKAYQTAVDELEEAIHQGQTKNQIFVHLAQAYYGLRNWEMVTLSVRNAEEAAHDVPDMFLMKARAHQKLDEQAMAWRALAEGRELFPDNRAFLREQIFLLVDLKLYQMAMGLGTTYLESGDATEEDYIAVADAFRKAGESKKAQMLLEEARLTFPDSSEVLVHLAHAYISGGHPGIGGTLMQVAAEYDPKYIRESAELFRRAGRYDRALYMNSRVSDQTEKFQQRVAILVEKKEYERVAALKPRLARLGLLENPKIRYAMAYAHFQTRDWDQAETLLKQIDDPDLYESAVELRRAIDSCRDDPTRC